MRAADINHEDSLSVSVSHPGALAPMTSETRGRSSSACASTSLRQVAHKVKLDLLNVEQTPGLVFQQVIQFLMKMTDFQFSFKIDFVVVLRTQTILRLDTVCRAGYLFSPYRRLPTEACGCYIAMAAFLYACLRFVEAYGLWHMRAWATWLGVITGGAYLPIEIYQLFHRVTAPKIGLLCVNLIVVGYLILGLLLSAPPTTALSEA